MSEIAEIYGQAKGEALDKSGLTYIRNFGWLRTQELGRILWPKNKFAIKYAERQTRKWLKNELVIARNLPNHNGTAYVLGEKGVRFLAENANIMAKSGKDWGDTNKIWTAPIWWKHDLLANGLLALLYEQGYQVVPERQIRRENPGILKIPDGLAIKGNNVIWLEVESHRKSGKFMDDMVKAILNIHDAPALSGFQPNRAVVAYAKTSRDERIYNLNHELRVTEGIKRQAQKDVDLDFIELELVGAGPVKFSYYNKPIESDRVRVEMSNIFWDKQPDGSLQGMLNGTLIVIEKGDDGIYSWKVNEPKLDKYGRDTGIKRLGSGRSKTQTEAKKSAVKVVIGSAADL